MRFFELLKVKSNVEWAQFGKLNVCAKLESGEALIGRHFVAE